MSDLRTVIVEAEEKEGYRGSIMILIKILIGGGPTAA
jgi:hypothetical protein